MAQTSLFRKCSGEYRLLIAMQACQKCRLTDQCVQNVFYFVANFEQELQYDTMNRTTGRGQGNRKEN